MASGHQTGSPYSRDTLLHAKAKVKPDPAFHPGFINSVCRQFAVLFQEMHSIHSDIL